MKDNRRYWETLTPLPAESLAHVVKEAEAHGMEGLWAVQLFGPPFIPLAAAAMASRQLKLGTGVALAFTRSPLETALSAIDLDIISGGRAVLGIGTSLRWWNESWHGVVYGNPLKHLREVVQIVRDIIAQAHSGKLGRIEGEYHKLDLARFKTLGPPVRNRIPIYLPAVFESAVRMTAEIADGLVGHPIWSARWIANEVKQTLDATLAKAGRKRTDFDLNVWASVAIDKDRKRAIEDSRPTVAFYSAFTQYEKYYAAHGFGAQARAIAEASRRGDIAAAVKAVPDEMVDTFVIAGTPDEARERVAELWQNADSMTLMPPLYSLGVDKIVGYQKAIADTFYRS
jgi:probable F420-dependent oxidoreductase